MINPETVRKLKLLQSLIESSGDEWDKMEFKTITTSFEAHGTLTRAEAVTANMLYKKLKSIKSTKISNETSRLKGFPGFQAYLKKFGTF